MKIPTDCKGKPDKATCFPKISLMKRQGPFREMLTLAAEKAEKELLAEYPEEKARPVIKKLRDLVAGIRCGRGNKTLCIFVSPLAENVYYFTPTPELLI